MKKLIKPLLLVGLLLLGASKGFAEEVKFKLNSSLDKLHGGFKKSNVKVTNEVIEGDINLKSLWSSKPKKNQDLMEYFEAEDHPVGTFKVKVNGNKLKGIAKLKGEDFKLVGEVKNGEAKIRLSLKKLVGGFKSNFISEKDNVEMTIKMK